MCACSADSDHTATGPPPSQAVQVDPAPSDDGGRDPDNAVDDALQPPPDVPKPDPDDFPGKDERTAEGAEQAFRYYWAILHWAHITGEVDALDNLYSETCKACNNNAAVVADLQEMGRYWSPTQIDDLYIEAFESEQFEFEVSYAFVHPEHSEPVKGNTKERSVEGKTYYVGGALEWAGNGWVVVGMDLDIDSGEEL